MPQDSIAKYKEHLVALRRGRSQTLDQAATSFKALPGIDAEMVDEARRQLEAEARMTCVLDLPRGATVLNYRAYVDDVRRRPWYEGPHEFDRYWPDYRRRLAEMGIAEAVTSIDRASTKIVSQLSDPGVHGMSKKGLVVGHVQSGKTANYTAVIAKAADAGYRFFVVLAGLHNGLRRQTQMRLERDLAVSERHQTSWVPLTTANWDFGRVVNGAALARQSDLRMLAVVKKNPRRLRNLKTWLQDIPDEIRRRLPTLIIDDEADQATPNTAAARATQSSINRLLVEIFGLMPTGTYVGYTATPFANVLMDANDPDQLYPSDFIVDLPRPDGYFGAETIFGSVEDDDAECPTDGLDMVRLIPDDEVAGLAPPSRKDLRSGFQYTVTSTLQDALRWFILAVAARGARGDVGHSSMLVHTTQMVDAQFELADVIEGHVATLDPDDPAFEHLWNNEAERVPAERWGLPKVSWEDVSAHLERVLGDLRVVVDNGVSEERLDYDRLDEQTGEPLIETVIAVGGNTLSRGLTLEGLIVSFFCRRVATYDTLLQMGRWFGFRSGYEDLPRVWVTAQILSNYRFLSFVEQEIREDIGRYERESLTPDQLGVRIRTHPSMAVTAKAKMFHAQRLNISYGGKRLQTFHFHHRDLEELEANLATARSLISAALTSSTAVRSRGRWIIRDVPKEHIMQFFACYRFHEDHAELDSKAIVDYLEQRDDARARTWNLAIAGSTASRRTVGGQMIDLGQAELSLPEPVNMINRARMAESPRPDTADLKAIMSRPDRFLDVDPALLRPPLPADEAGLTQLREELTDGRGLLILYPISPHSVPMGATRTAERPTREALDALAPIVGVGVIFPTATASTLEAEYVGLELGGVEVDEDEVLVDERAMADAERDIVVDGADFVSEQQ